MTIKNLSYLFFIFSLFSLTSYAQKNKSFYIHSKICNKITKEPIDSVNYTLTLNDTIIVSEGMTRVGGAGVFDILIKLTKLGRYKLLFHKQGYDDGIATVNVRSYNLADYYCDVFLKKERILRAATVTATKIAMVMKGDTIVYDADAFELAEGSMLDALVARLPGAQLRSSGQIFVNGEKIEKLLVNGRDFFSGDAKVALDNLPTYMVNKIKVYRKENDDAYLVGASKKEDLPLVMDVNLKKQYSIGWVSNTEGGIGTDNRWMGKLFALRFTPHSHVGVFVNANNTSDDSKPGSSTDLSPLQVQMQQRKLITSGIDVNVEEAKRKWSLSNNVQGSINRETENSHTNGSYFLTGEPVWKRALDYAYNKKSQIKYAGEGKVKLKKYSGTYNLGASYSESKKNTWSSSMDLNENIDEDEANKFLLDRIYSKSVADKIISDYVDMGQGKSTVYQLNMKSRSTIGLPIAGNSLINNISVSYNHGERKDFSYYNLKQKDTESLLNRYQTMPSHSLDATGSLLYRMQRDPKKLNIQFSYTANYKEETGNRELYNLHEIGNDWQNDNRFGQLPSSTSDLMEVIDRANSFYSTNKTLANEVLFSIRKWGYYKLGSSHRGEIEFSLKPSFYRDELLYKRAAIDTSMVHKSFFIIPKISINFNANSWISYTIDEKRIDLLQRLNIYDNSNPLIRQFGNENLKRVRTHKINSRIKLKGILMFVNYQLTKNAVAQAFNYDRSTGVSTYRPVNVNGNWEANADFILYNKMFGKKKNILLSGETYVSYANSVDYVVSSGEAIRSSVRGILQTNDYSLSYYSKKGYEIGIRLGSKWNHKESHRDGFSTINAFDYNYGINGQVKLPLGFQFSTDFGVYARTGYQNHALNTTDVVWNLRLSKTFLKGNLICYVDAFDVLGQLENVRYVLTTQGTTETRYNVMPRYAMLHLVLHLAKKPKKADKR